MINEVSDKANKYGKSCLIFRINLIASGGVRLMIVRPLGAYLFL